MICNRCNVMMKSGTRYEQREGRSFHRRFDECPKCREKKFNNQSGFLGELKKSIK